MMKSFSCKLWQAAAVASSLFITACNGQQPLLTPQTPTTPEPAPASPAPTLPLVAPEPSLPQAPPQHHVALLAPISGVNAAIGQSIANAATMAMLDLNNNALHLKVYDTAPGVTGATERALADGAQVILGPLLAADARTIAPLLTEKGVTAFTFSNDDTLAAGKMVVLGFDPEQEVTRVVNHALAQGIRRFAALTPQGDYGRRASKAFVAAVRAGGGTITGMESYARDRKKLFAAARRITDFDSRNARARVNLNRSSSGVIPAEGNRLPPPPFEALLIADSGSLTQAFLPILQQFGVGPGAARLLGPGLWAADASLSRNVGMRGAWFATVPDAAFEALTSRYRARFGSRPSRLASLGYDAVLLTHNATQQGWVVGTPFPLASTRNKGGFTGIDGLFRITLEGETRRGLAVMEVRSSGFATIDSAPKGF